MINIRVSARPNGDIEAAVRLHDGRGYVYVVVSPKTRAVLFANVAEGSDMFRKLVRAARDALS